MSTLIFFFFFFFFFFLSPLISKAIPSPSSSKFTYVNEGQFGTFTAEYNATYRPLPISKPPFQLCFYNTTPNSYTLALGMFTTRAHPVHWVWEGNRGEPVRENAKLVFQQDGNLQLVDFNGHVAWQTNTGSTNIAATKLRLSGKGNLILFEKNGAIIWQSFDHPTDTLLIGQSLVQDKGPTKLVSQASNRVSMDGPYSLVMEPERVSFYYQGRNSPTPLIYDVLFRPDEYSLDFMRFGTIKSKNGYDIILRFSNFSLEDIRGYDAIGSVNYSSHSSFLRLGIDGNLKAFTYNNGTNSWNQTYARFNKFEEWALECRLPEKCGSFGLCDKNQCVACPSPTGLSKWTKDCSPTKITTCKAEDVGYYKLVGVSQYTALYPNEHMEFTEEPECRKKCTSDCKCLGYFFMEDMKQCSVAYDLMTLQNVTTTVGLTGVTYIKYQLK